MYHASKTRAHETNSVQDHFEQLARGALLLTVNQRLSRHYAAQYQQWQWSQGKPWWETPQIMPMRAWLTSMHASAINNGESTLTLLPELLQLRAWRNCIEQDTDLALLNSEAAGMMARQAWEIACVWRCMPEEGDYLPLDQFAWQRWQSRYQSFMSRQACVDEASLPTHLQVILESGGLRGDLPEKVILAGFIQLPPQLESLMDTIRAMGIAVERLQPVANACTHRLTYADDAQELLGIATMMRSELEREPTQTLGLVIPDLHVKRAAVLRAFDQVFFPALSPEQIREHGRPYDLSIGLPLADTAIVAAALSILKLCISSVKGSEISAFLMSPYLLAAAAESRRREQLDRRLREQRLRKLDLTLLQEKLYPGSQLAPPIKRLLQSRKLSRTTLSDWASRFSGWLAALGWPGKGMNTDEYQAVSAWLECLDDMQLLDDGSDVSCNDAFHELWRLATDRVFQLDTPRTAIQIMGRLESHGLSFDCLWIAGLDAEQWPPVGAPNPLLPIARQKLAGVPDASATARLALAEREFLQWCSQAPLLIASHALQRDGKALVEAQLPPVQAAEENVALAEPRIRRLQSYLPCPAPAAVLQQSLSLEFITDDHGPALPAGSKVSGGARLFENQALCPFRAFALHRLNIRPLEEAGLGLDPRQHGTLLHYALELFWTSVRSRQAMLALTDEAFNAQVLAVVDQAILEQAVPETLQLLERTRLADLLKQWLLENEAKRAEFEVANLEQRLTIEHGGIVMEVILDRIDRVGDALLLIDYKTGTSNKVNTWADKRIVNPQLPLYVLTNDEIQGASFAQVARNQCAFRGVASEDSYLPGVKTTVRKSGGDQATSRELQQWDDWRAHWQEALDAVAIEVRQGLATVTPMKTACLHCELKSLCRIGDTADDETEEASNAG